MNRKPIYSFDRNTRIISRPNGLWEHQGITNMAPSSEQDHWQALHRPTTFEAARGQLTPTIGPHK